MSQTLGLLFVRSGSIRQIDVDRALNRRRGRHMLPGNNSIVLRTESRAIQNSVLGRLAFIRPTSWVSSSAVFFPAARGTLRASLEQDELVVVDVEHECIEQLRARWFVDLVMCVDHDVLDRRAVQGHAPVGLCCDRGRRGGIGERALCLKRPWHRRQTEPSGEIARAFENVFQRRCGRDGGRHGLHSCNGKCFAGRRRVALASRHYANSARMRLDLQPLSTHAPPPINRGTA